MYHKSKNQSSDVYKYFYTDEFGRERCIEIHAGEYGWTELTIETMQKADHKEALGDRYYEEAKSPLVEWKKKRYQDANDDDTYEDPIDSLSDERSIPEKFVSEEYECKCSNAEMIDRVRDFIKTLSPEQLHLYQELYEKRTSNRALAKSMNVTEGTIRYRNKKLLDSLKRFLGGE